MQKGWRRGRPWPPGPTVEDELDSLAHEFLASGISKSTDDEAKSRGSVDQLPLIVDANPPPSQPKPARRRPSQRVNHDGSVKSNSSVESLGPPTPPDNQDRRYVYIPHEGVEMPITHTSEDPKSKKAAAEGSKRREEARGRQPVPKIDTELGGDLLNLTGSRPRAPSPYAFKPHKEKETITKSSGEFFLSPESSTPSHHRFPNIDAKRPSSARPVGRKFDESSDSSDSGLRPPERKRSSRYSFTKEERPQLHLKDDLRPSVDKRSASYSFSKNDLVVPTKKSLLSDERRSTQDGRSSKTTSPYHSSDESSKARPRVEDLRSGTRSARPSFSKQQRPRLDEVDPRHSFDMSSPKSERRKAARQSTDNSKHYSYDGRNHLEPSTARTPKAMEDYFERAFHENRSKHLTSPNPSPLASPARTPPRSPTADSGFGTHSGSRHHRRSEVKPLTPLTPTVSHPTRPSLEFPPTGRSDTFPPSNGRTPSDSPIEERSSSRMAARYSVQAASPMITPRTSTTSHSSDDSNPRRSSTLPGTPRPFPLQQPPASRPTWSATASTDSLARVPIPESHIVPRNPLQLAACPRPRPVAGYNDWYTIRGFSEIDFCPSCMSQIGGSKFRDHFVPSLPKPRAQEVLCAFALPWMRMAWLQTIKQERDSLKLLFRIQEHAAQSKPCAGKEGAIGFWYRLPDPKNGSPVPNFEVCSTCVRNVEILMPEIRGVFQRNGHLAQERTCDLRCDSKRFATYLDLLDAAATRAFEERRDYPDMRAFADHTRRTTAIRECSQDSRVIGQPWHILTTLPEFTICEECYEEVVYPLADQPLAAKVYATPQTIGSHDRGISCQLYSPRMRKVFAEAVKYNDFEYLRNEATRRFRVEKLLQERYALLMRSPPDTKRADDLKRNIEEWKKWE